MNLILKTSGVNTSAKKNRVIKYIVVHYTAGVSSSGKSDENVAAWFARSTTKASSDFIVDDDSVTQFNGDIKNRYTWHCGGSKYKTKGGSLHGVCTNANSIGVEICSSNRTGKVASANDSTWYFTDATLRNAAELIRLLMDECGIGIDHVIRHYDVTGKLCPGVVGWNADSGSEGEWARFKAMLSGSVDAVDYKALYEAEKARNDELEKKIKEIMSICERIEESTL